MSKSIPLLKTKERRCLDFAKYKFRCSALGKLAGNEGKLSQLNKTYLTELYIGEVNNVQKQITSPYFEKGDDCEEDGISMVNVAFYPNDLLIKNTDQKENDYIYGTCDIIAPDDCIYDIKNAWDLFTLGKASLNTDYYWQLIGYMWLWDKKKSTLFYCINNLSEKMLVDMEMRLFYSGNYVTQENPEYLEKVKEMREMHNYDGMDIFDRFRFWDIEFNEDNDFGKKDINILIERIKLSRKFLVSLDEEKKEERKRNISRMQLFGNNITM